MKIITARQAESRTMPRCRARNVGRLLRAAVVGALLACAVPVVVSTANAQTEVQADAPYKVAFLGVPSQGLTPGLPPPHLIAQASGEDTGMSTRSIAAGFILVLFAGLAALTFTMWRDLGRQVGTR